MEHFALVADLGGTTIAVARVGSTGKITHSLLAPTPPAGGAGVVETIANLLTQLPAQGACAIGVGVPGVAYPDGSVWAPNISGWKRMPLARMLGEQFKLPVLVDSDRNAFVTGEKWHGLAQDCSDVIFVMIGTGIGAGIISGGRLLRGHGELSGCAGWMAVRDKFLLGYEAVGCLEFHASGTGIARAARQVFHEPMTTQHLVELARAGDEKAMQTIAEAGRILGLGLANLVSILNPQIIVVGGGVAAAGNLLLTPARQTLRQWAQPLAAKQVRVVRSHMGSRAGILGVAKLCFDQFQL
jgi:glucokinase